MRDVPRMHVAGLIPFGAVLAATVLLTQCRPIQDSQIKADLEAGASASPSAGVEVLDQGGGTYRVRFPVGQGSPFRSGQKVNLRYGVVNKWSTEPIACGALSGGPTAVQIKVSGGYAEFQARVNPQAFERCNDADDGRKLSLECQNSGDWDGPKAFEGCLYDDANSFLVGGRAVPKKETRGFGLADIEHTNDVLNYGKVCAQRLGSLPRDWSCLDGEIIPITLNGQEVPFGQHQPTDKCDKPVYLGLGDQGQCVPYARLGRLYTAPNVETVFICRRYKIGNTRNGSGVSDHIRPDVPLFQDVAIVQHNVKTGESCYFQALSGFSGGRDLPAARIPPPDEEVIPDDIARKYSGLPDNQRPVLATEFWIKPSDPGTDPRPFGRGFQCVKCHDSDPYMHSPYVDQLNFDFNFVAQRPNTIPPAAENNLVTAGVGTHPFAGQNDKMVPCDPGAKGSGPGQLSNPECLFIKGNQDYSRGKYSQVHEVHQQGWPNSFAIAPKEDDTCVRCHRIGSINACASWAPDSVGDENGLPRTTRNQRSDYGRLFPASHWMPITQDFFSDDPACRPDVNNPEGGQGCSLNLQTWQQTFGEGARKMQECCVLSMRNTSGDPSRDSEEFNNKCVRVPITTPPPSTGGSDSSVLGITQEVTLADNASTEIPLGTVETEGRVSFIKFDIKLTHGSHGDLKMVLKNGATEAVIFDGQNSATPNRGGPLTLSLNSADNEGFGDLLGEPAAGNWVLEVQDLGQHETGIVQALQVTVSHGE